MRHTANTDDFFRVQGAKSVEMQRILSDERRRNREKAACIGHVAYSPTGS